MSAPSAVVGRSRTLTYANASVERFHSVRKFLSYDGAHTNSCSTSSAGDEFDVYSNWSSRPLSSIQDVTVSDEDISANGHWVSWTVDLILLLCVQ